MCKDAVFASEDTLVTGHGLPMVDVSVYGRGPVKIIYLRNALNSLKLLVHSFSVGYGCCVLVLLKGDNVVGNTVEVVSGSDCRGLWRPRISCLSILFVL